MPTVTNLENLPTNRSLCNLNKLLRRIFQAIVKTVNIST
jgi:hypothetical protein